MEKLETPITNEETVQADTEKNVEELGNEVYTHPEEVDDKNGVQKYAQDRRSVER